MRLLKQIILIMFFSIFISCGKELLDIKRNADQVVPATIQDYQALMDRKGIMNQLQSYELSLTGGDEYSISEKVWQNDLTGNYSYFKNAYIWAEDVFEEKESKDWNRAYQRILYANMALDIEKITPIPSEQEAWNNVKGSALFFRALNYYQLVQIFCKPYNAQTVNQDLGVPLRLDYDITLKIGRGTLNDVYTQMINDLDVAIKLLPNVAEHIFRPSKLAVYHLLAKIYLNMGEYALSLEHTDSALSIYNTLLDFNLLDLKAANTFSRDDFSVSHPEVFFYSNSLLVRMFSFSRVNIPNTIFDAYDINDLRRDAYFNKQNVGRRAFKGSYHFQGDAMFTGFATDELWLMSAECKARLGDFKGAMEDINHLLKYRYKTGTFIPFSFDSEEEVLPFVLKERRKQLFMRGVRWEDLRRLNSDPRFAMTLVRDIGDKRYELLPSDPKWVWPIPPNEIDLNGLEQNIR